MLYKYRGLNSFKFFTDILLKRRLYAAQYFNLNDPMEGQYLYTGSGSYNKDMENLLKRKKDKIRICSLSRDPDNALMWSHYANGERGVVIGVDIDRDKYEVRPIEYDGPTQLDRHTINPNSAIDVLSHKLEAWEYEKEERVFVNKDNFVSVRLNKIICGSRMSNQDYSLVSGLANSLCPNVNLIRK